ncbi:CASTOR/POLLUX-related putative ion channel [Pseudolysinimonas yzui]|uniref:Lipoprotein n=1 Tax=Pseudolysinimonas yzui TaxID=2708254 RepID=A0A8J3GPT2_9MICO|nr:potassium transporter TrkA [Pseudolysinimonas yzui]GHF11488.1 lipoprotein [Pseudolysinimonas yzui]
MSTKPSAGERLRYWFDNWMSRGPVALMALLGVATVAFVVVLGTIAWIVLTLIRDDENLGDDSTGPLDLIWRSLMRTLDPGTMGGDQEWPFRIMMLIVTIGGLVIVASLIGIVSGAFDSKVEELRKGRSRVLEQDHTLILGWSTKVFPIVREISIANLSRGKSAIVILADRDKVEMEDDIKAQVGDTGKTKIIVRSGDPMNLAELEVANPHTARSIVVLAPDEADDPDSTVIKTALAVTNNPRRKEGSYHIVGELQDPGNLEAATLVGRDEAHWVLSTELISRITVQTCRQSGLSVVYSELLDFDGAEIYFTEQPSLVGKTYFDAQLAFDTSAVMGLVQGGKVTLNPAADTVLAAGDLIIVIAEDDDAILLAEPGAPDLGVVSDSVVAPATPESTLVLGHNEGLQLMLTELDGYSTPRSRVSIVADVEQPGFDGLVNLDVTFQRGDPTSRAVLDALYVHEFDHIIVLAAKETLPAQRADAKTLITLLHLRDIAVKKGADLNVVSEMIDDRNRELAEVTQADDFIVSDQLISLMLSQLSENKRLTDVFDELFSASGAEIYLRPASLYVPVGVEADFYTVLEAARRRGETAIGFRLDEFARSSERAYGVTVNPTKTQKRAFAAGDKVIVLSDH